MDFGLNLILTFTDRATNGLQSAAGSLETITAQVTSQKSALDKLGATFGSLATMGTAMTAAVTAPIGGFIAKITQYGIARASFVEDSKLAFTTLMGSAADASTYLNDLMSFAKTTPFTYEAITSAAQNMIAVGIDSTTILGDKMNDFKGGLLQALGDIAGATGAGASGFAYYADVLGKISAEGKASSIRLDQLARAGLNLTDVLGKSEDEIKKMAAGDLIDELVKNANEKYSGMMAGLKQTWTGAKDTFVSSLKTAGLELMGAYQDADGVTKYAFLDTMTKSLNQLSGAIKNVAPLLQPVMDFVKSAMEKGGDAIEKFANSIAVLNEKTGERELTAKGKILSKIVTALMGLGPVLIIVGKFGKSITGVFKAISLAGSSLVSSLGGWGLLFAGLFVAWHTDLFGVQSMVFDFVSGIIDAWNVAKNATSQSAEDMMKVYNNLDRGTFFGALTAGIMKAIVFIQALADAWSDGEMDAELYQKAVDLGVIDLVSRILDLKYRVEAFVQGFKEGWQEMSDAVSSFVEGALKKLEGTWLGDALDGIIDGITNFLSVITSADIDKWEDFGKTMGKIAPFVVALGGAFLAFKGLKKIFKPVSDLAKGGKKAESALSGMSQGASNFAKNAVGLGIAAAGLWLLADAAIRLVNAGPGAVAMFVVMGGTLAGLMVLASKLGSTMNEASTGLIAFGASILMVAGGFALMAFAATSLSNAGTGAMVMFGVMMGTVIALVALIGVFGNAIATATPGLLAFGAALLMVGIGMNLLVFAATSLASAGGLAIGIMIGMVVAVAALAAVFAALGAPLAVAAPGMLAFGVALLMVGAAVLLASAGMTMLAGVLPQIAEYGLSASVAIAALGASMMLFGAGALIAGAGALVAGAGLLVFGAGAVVATAGAVPLAAALLLVSTEMSGIASDAVKAAASLTTMVASVSVVEQGLNALGNLVDNAGKALANLFSSTPDYSGPAQAIASSMAVISTSATTLGTSVTAVNSQLSAVVMTLTTMSMTGILTATALNQIANAFRQMVASASSGTTAMTSMANSMRVLNVTGATSTQGINTFKTTISGLSGTSGVVSSSLMRMTTGFRTMTTQVTASTNNFRTSMQSMTTASSSMVSQVTSNFSRLTSGINSAMSSAVGAVRNGVAQMKAAMNFSWSLPHLKVPHISVSGKFNVDPPSAPNFSVAWYAKGGVVDKPSVIGVGENGAEAVMPLENNTGWIDVLAKSISDNMSNRIVTQAVPVAQPQNVGFSDEYGGGEVNTITNNNGGSTNTDARSIDNSVTFGEGSIVIQTTGNNGDIDVHNLAVRLMNEIARIRQKQQTLDYGIDFAAGGV